MNVRPLHTMYAATLIPSSGAILLPTEFNVQGLVGWRPGRWQLWRAGYVPPTGSIVNALFRFAADGSVSPTYLLGIDGQGMQVVEPYWDLPRGWSGQIQWLPGGVIFGNNQQAELTWASATPVLAWMQFAMWADEQEQGAQRGC